MNVASYIFGIVTALAILGLVLELLRRGRLKERHALWWVIAGVLALIAAVFPATLEWFAGLVGVEVPLNLVLFTGIAILFIVSLQQSAELNRLEEKTRVLAEEVTLLKLSQEPASKLESSD